MTIKTSKTFETEAESRAFMLGFRLTHEGIFCSIDPEEPQAILLDAIRHANSVTYHMGIVDSLAESRGFVYVNSESSEEGLSADAKKRISEKIKQAMAV